MKPAPHIIVSGIISVFVWSSFHSVGYAAVSFVAGVAIDIDHFLDYYLNHGLTIKIKEIYRACAYIRLKKLYLILHSYELLFLLWAFIYFMSLGTFWKAMAIGLTQHMIFDQLTNPINAFGYFLAYRIAKGFKKDIFCHEK